MISLRKLDLSGKDPSEATKVLKSKLIEKGYSSADLASSSIDAVINKAELDKELEELGVAPRENSIREESESISTNRRRSVEKLSSYRDFFSSEEEEEEEADESSQEDSANDSGNETGEDMNSSDNSD